SGNSTRHPRACGDPVFESACGALNARRKLSGILGRPVEPGDDSGECAHFIRSSSHAGVIAARKLLYVCGRFRALALLKREGGGSAERRVVNKPRLVFRIAGRQVHTATPLGAPPRRLKTPVRSSGDVATLGDFAPHACPRPARLLAEPCSGPGRKPGASRACACEAQPQAPHPAGLGYPAPAKLLLCPTSGSPLEAPLIGQDGSRIREVSDPGIRNRK